ncbi:MAG: Fic family protein [Coriobacteriales bacterium]
MVHSGVHPESLIIEDLEKSLRLLNDDTIEPLVRAAVFHYLFGYIHPFYDGNGRVNRFISSYVLSRHYEPIVGLRLSFAIKEHISAYYKAYETCEHALNRGDLTPFVIAFCEIAVAAMESMKSSLAERLDSLDKYSRLIEHSRVCADRQTREVALNIVSATLFSAYGLTPAQLAQLLCVSRQTVYKRVEPLKAAGWLVTAKVGRKTYYTLDLDRLAE